jgi:hypothetical protein
MEDKPGGGGRTVHTFLNSLRLDDIPKGLEECSGDAGNISVDIGYLPDFLRRDPFVEEVAIPGGFEG